MDNGNKRADLTLSLSVGFSRLVLFSGEEESDGELEIRKMKNRARKNRTRRRKKRTRRSN